MTLSFRISMKKLLLIITLIKLNLLSSFRNVFIKNIASEFNNFKTKTKSAKKIIKQCKNYKKKVHFHKIQSIPPNVRIGI